MKRFTYFKNGVWRVKINGVEYAGFSWVDRFAAYESTGMEPEEIAAMKNAFMGRELAKITELEGVPITRMCELAQAEKDRRLVIESPNDPLTLDELRQMEGEPVWVVLPERDASFWALLREEWLNGMCMSTREIESAYGAFELYGKTWLAYRRRLEEGNNDQAESVVPI